MKKIYTAQDMVQAQLLHDILQKNGVDVVLVENQHAFPLTTVDDFLPTIWLRNLEDLPKAHEVIEQFTEEYQTAEIIQPEQSETWTCPTCGEAIEKQFTECWKCAQN